MSQTRDWDSKLSLKNATLAGDCHLSITCMLGSVWLLTYPAGISKLAMITTWWRANLFS